MYTYLPNLGQRQCCLEEMTVIFPSSHLINSSNPFQSDNYANLLTGTTLARLRRYLLVKGCGHFSLLSCLISLLTTPSFLKLSPYMTSRPQQSPDSANFLYYYFQVTLIMSFFFFPSFKSCLCISQHCILFHFTSSSTWFPSDDWFYPGYGSHFSVFICLIIFLDAVHCDLLSVLILFIFLKSIEFCFIDSYLWLSLIKLRLLFMLVKSILCWLV